MTVKELYIIGNLVKHTFKTVGYSFLIVWLIMFALGQFSVTVNTNPSYYSIQVEKNK